MPHASGSALYATFSGTVITGDQRSMSWDQTINVIDVTAGSDPDAAHVLGMRDNSVSMTILYNGTDGTEGTALYSGAQGSLVWGPEGTASGKPKYRISASVTSVSYDVPYDDAMMMDVEFKTNGAWAENWNLLGSTW